MVKAFCKWCGIYTETYSIGTTKEGERRQVRCHKCLNLIPSSKKENTDNVNRKHVHAEWGE